MKTKTTIVVITLPSASSVDWGFVFEQGGRDEDARYAQPFEEAGTDVGGNESANDLAIGSDPLPLKREDFLHADDVFFHAGDLRDTGYLARSVAHAGGLHDDGDGRRNLLAHRFFGHIHVAHGDHRFEPGDGIAWGVGVNGGHGAFVAGIHGLEHVEGFFTAHLADDDAIGAHTQAVDEKLTLADGALAFNVGGAGFEADDV